MNLDNFNPLDKDDKTKDNFFTNLIENLQQTISTFIKNNSNGILENSIYVVRDINNEKLSLVDIENGKDFDIYVVSSSEQISKLNEQGIYDNIYEMSKDDLYSLNLGSNIQFNAGKFKPYYDKVEIKNPEASAKLEDMYFCLEQEKNATFSVSKVSDDKVFLTNTTEGGLFSIPQEKYPDFKVGDLVKYIDGKYVLI